MTYGDAYTRRCECMAANRTQRSTPSYWLQSFRARSQTWRSASPMAWSRCVTPRTIRRSRAYSPCRTPTPRARSRLGRWIDSTRTWANRIASCSGSTSREVNSRRCGAGRDCWPVAAFAGSTSKSAATATVRPPAGATRRNCGHFSPTRVTCVRPTTTGTRRTRTRYLRSQG
jgi:hypothetical protein